MVDDWLMSGTESKPLDITIDKREPTNFLFFLTEHGLACQMRLLPTGDFLLYSGKEGVLIERKTVSDFVASVDDKRLWSQLKGLADSEGVRPLLLVEGNLGLELGKRNIPVQSFLGIVSSIFYDFGLSIIVLPTEEWTKYFLLALSRRLGPTDEKRPYELRPSPSREMTMEEKIRFVLEGFRGCGGKTSRTIIGDKKANNLLDFLTRFEELAPERFKSELRKILLYPWK